MNPAQSRTIGTVHDGVTAYSLTVVDMIAEPSLPYVLLAAGVHGNEPASAEVLEAFLSEEEVTNYRDRFNFIAFPRINPVGLARGTRGNGLGVDLNRDFFDEPSQPESRAVTEYLAKLNQHFLVAIDCHEDVTDEIVPGFDPAENPTGFYLYEIVKREDRIGPAIIDRLRSEGIEIATNRDIYGEACEDGVIWSDPRDVKLYPGQFDGYLHRYTPHTFVLETPTHWPYDRRVAGQRTTITTVLELL